MQKIPTLFIRDKQNPKRVTREVDPDCQWVIDGEGSPTEKYDGSACAVIDGKLYKRHQHKTDKGDAPSGWIHWSMDTEQRSGHGWLLCVPGDPSCRYHFEAWEYDSGMLAEGTYELVGPKSNGNPHRLDHHELWPHGQAFHPDHIHAQPPRDFDGLAAWLGKVECEGIVWHHPDGRMAKIKRRDFGHPWPAPRNR